MNDWDLVKMIILRKRVDFAIFPSCLHVYIVDKVFSKRTCQSNIEVNIEK